MDRQIYKFYPDTRHPAYQMGSSVFNIWVSRPALDWHWQISAQVWKHNPQTIVIEHGIALTADAAERAVGCALRDF